MVHIGKQIQEELKRQERSITWFAKKINCERTNVYSIFKRKSLDTALLLKISKVLNVNFFDSYHNELQNDCKKDSTKCDFYSHVFNTFAQYFQILLHKEFNFS